MDLSLAPTWMECSSFQGKEMRMGMGRRKKNNKKRGWGTLSHPLSLFLFSFSQSLRREERDSKGRGQRSSTETGQVR